MVGSHRPTLRNLQFHFYHTREHQHEQALRDAPDSSHETVYEELVFFCGSLFSCIPDFGITPFHEPSFEIDWVGKVGIGADFIGRKRKGFEGRVEVCNSVLGEEADEV